MSSATNRIVCGGARALAAVCAATMALVGCSGNATSGSDGNAAPGDDNGTHAVPVGPPAAGTLTAFRLTRAPRSGAELARGGSGLATILRGTALPAARLQAAFAGAGGAPDVLDVAVEAAGLQFSYRADNDRRLVIDEAVTNSMAAGDIGKAAAGTVFASTFRSVLDAGLITATGMNMANAHSSTIVRGEGVSGQAPTEWISEYVFTVPRSINGIEVFDAGLEVSVHRTGQLARLQVFGPSVTSTTSPAGAEVPDASGYSFSPSVSQAALDARVATDYPGAEVRAIGVRYWLPPGVTDAVVEPAQMYFVAPTSVIDGQKVKARGHFVAYSLRDKAQTAVIWPPAEQHPSGDGRK